MSMSILSVGFDVISVCYRNEEKTVRTCLYPLSLLDFNLLEAYKWFKTCKLKLESSSNPCILTTFTANVPQFTASFLLARMTMKVRSFTVVTLGIKSYKHCYHNRFFENDESNATLGLSLTAVLAEWGKISTPMQNRLTCTSPFFSLRKKNNKHMFGQLWSIFRSSESFEY